MIVPDKPGLLLTTLHNLLSSLAIRELLFCYIFPSAVLRQVRDAVCVFQCMHSFGLAFLEPLRNMPYLSSYCFFSCTAFV